MNQLISAANLTGNLPESDWLRFGVLLLILLAVLQTVRLISRVNRAVMLFVVIVGTAGLLATWVRHRSEPAFLTPVVDVVAPFFPAKLRSIDA